MGNTARHRFYFMVIFMFCCVSCFSQHNDTYYIRGLVVDTVGVEIGDVAIYDNQGYLFAVSDRNGAFNIYVKKKIQLKFTHISFENKYINLNMSKLESLEDGSYPLVIVMKRKSNLLPEAYIVENAPHLAYKNEEVWVIDYKVTKDGIFLIANKSFGNVLLHLDFEQDTISRKKIANKFDRLYQDGFGNIHLLSKDSTYQVYCDGKDLQLLYGVSYNDFKIKLLPLVAVTDSIIVIEKRMYHDQEIVYEAVNKNTKKHHYLADIYGSSREMAKSWNLDAYRLMLSKYPDASMLFVDRRSDVNEVRDEFNEAIEKRLMLQPIYSPIYHVGKYLYIFDLENNNLIKFDELGEEIRKMPISFHQKSFNKKLVTNNPWENNIIIDSYSGCCYTQYEDGGIVSLKEIDIESGNVLREIKLDNHTFQTDIQVYAGEVYYLYRDFKSNDVERRSLYNMKIEK